MATSIFVNLAVKDLEKSKAFFLALGYTFNPQFTNDQGAALVISSNIYAMLLTEDFFKTFTSKQLIDTSNSVEVLTALSVDSKEEVDQMVEKGVAAGGKEPKAAQDLGFMYSRTLEDLDGHTWEFVWMDPAHIQDNPS